MLSLVSTSRSLLALDLGTGEAKEIHTGKGLYFGITYSNELIFVGARNNYDCFEYLDNIQHFSGSVLVFNYNLDLVGEINMPTMTTVATLRDLHQILFLDDKLWLICALDNMVMINDFDGWDYWFPSDNKKERWKDIHHFNSLWVDFDMSSIYILAHQRGPSDIWKFSYPDLELEEKIELGEEAHNIWKFKSKLYTCDSKKGTVVSENDFELQVGDFTRGAVITDQCFVIGTSDIAKKDERHKSSAAVHVYNTNWQKVKQINIKDYGQVNDIRVPGVFDVCHHWMLGKIIDLGWENRINFEVEEMNGNFSNDGGI